MTDLNDANDERALADLVSKFHREQQGHPPEAISAYILPQMAVVRSTGVFTATEKTLAGSMEGQKLIQSARREQRALTRREIENQVGRKIGKEVTRSFYDIDVRTGEQVEIYVFD